MKIIEIITNQNFLGAVFSTLFVILLSFFLRRKNIIRADAKNVISNIVLKLALPAMAFSAFMTDLNANEFKSNFQVLLLGLFLYSFLIITSTLIFKFIFKNISQSKKDVYTMIITFCTASFFASPVIEGYYGDIIKIPEYLMIVVFRLFLYTYAYFKMAGIKVDKAHLGMSIKKFLFNPIVIATFLGFLIWSLQNVLPQIQIESTNASYCLLRIDKTMPFLYQPIYYLSKMATPLSWILIGVTIGELPFASAIKDKNVWFWSAVRTIIVPLIVLGLCVLAQTLEIVHLTKYGFAACVLTLSASSSAVINSYAIQFDKEVYFVSDVSLISTIMCMITMPIMLVIVELIGNSTLFI